MASLLQVLQDIAPSITASMAADLRSALVAINQEAEADPTSMERSLNTWWQWLDDEGYNGEAFLRTLRQLCAAQFGDQSLAQLVDFCGSSGDDPDGLSLLQVQLEQIDMDLPLQLHSLEAMALTEDSELAQTAGGMSKILRDSLITGSVGMFCGVLWYAKSKRKGQEQVVDVAKQQAVGKEHAVVDMVHKGDQTLIQDGRFVKNDTAEVGMTMVQKIAANPRKSLAELAVLDRDVFQNYKEISAYSPKDVEFRAARLAVDHTMMHVGEAVERQVANEVISSQAFRDQVLEVAKKDPKFEHDYNFLSDEKFFSANKEVFAQAEKDVINGDSGDWFANAKINLKNTGLESRLRDEEVTKAYDAYHTLLTEEVRLAKKQAADDLKNPFYELTLGDERAVIGKSAVVVQKDIDVEAKRVKNAMRDTEIIVEDDVRAVERGIV